MRHLFPSQEVTLDDCFHAFDTTTISGSPCTDNSWQGQERALYRCGSKYGKLEVVTDIVQPRFDLERHSCAWFHGVDASEYHRRLEAYLHAGWIVFTDINYRGAGPVLDARMGQGGITRNATDHVVILDGIREEWRDTSNGKAKVLCKDVHVVCSARGAYWIDVRDLLLKHGAAAWRLCRKEA